jgi:hypothetical protein
MSESSKAARVFTRCYDRVLDLVLSRHAWPFALKAQALAASPDAAFPGWAYRYEVPSDCLNALAVCDANGVRASLKAVAGCDTPLPLTDGRVDFDTVWGSQASNIVTDLAGAYLIYTVRVTETGRFPPLFGEALACRLAMEAGPALAGELGVRLAQKLQQDYEVARAEAIAQALNEGRDTLQAATPSVQARGGY